MLNELKSENNKNEIENPPRPKIKVVSLNISV